MSTSGLDLSSLEAGPPVPNRAFEGRRVRTPDDATVYLVLNGLRCGIPRTAYTNLFATDPAHDTHTHPVRVFVDPLFVNIAPGPVLDDAAVLVIRRSQIGADKPVVFLISNGVKRPITNTAFDLIGFDDNKRNPHVTTRNVYDDSVLNAIPDGVPISV